MKTILISLFMMVSSVVYSYETTGKLSFEDNSIAIGEPKKATLEVYPITKMILEDLKQLENQSFIDYFKVTKVISLEQNENNPEVWKLSFELVLVKQINLNTPHIWSWKSLNIPIEFRSDLQVINDLENTNQILILDSETHSSQGSKLIIALLVLLALIIGALVYRELKKRKLHKQQKVQWKNIFANINERDDFERVYKAREVWIQKIPVDAPCVDQFFRVINSCQYKREWSDIELDQVRNAFDELKMVVDKL